MKRLCRFTFEFKEETDAYEKFSKRDSDGPKWVNLDIIDSCNLNCIYCFAKTKRKKVLSFEEARKIIDKLSQLKISELLISGGEPLLNKDIFRIASYAKMKGMVVHISSNGYLMTKENIKNIKESGITQVQINLDGINPETHDKIRGKPNSFDYAMIAVKNLVDEGVNVILTSVLLKINHDEILEIFKIAKRLNVSGYRLYDLIPSGMGKSNFEEMHVQPLKRKKLLEDLFVLSKELGVKKIRTLEGFVFDSNFKKFLYFGCLACKLGCSIRTNGDVLPCPCCTNEQFVLGNIKKEPLLKIWKQSENLKYFRDLKQSEMAGKCSECEYFNICKGGCRAAAVGYYGSPLASDPRCWR